MNKQINKIIRDFRQELVFGKYYYEGNSTSTITMVGAPVVEEKLDLRREIKIASAQKKIVDFLIEKYGGVDDDFILLKNDRDFIQKIINEFREDRFPFKTTPRATSGVSHTI